MALLSLIYDINLPTHALTLWVCGSDGGGVCVCWGWGWVYFFGGGHIQPCGGSLNIVSAFTGVIWIIPSFAACWAHPMCDHDLWPTSVNHPFSSPGCPRHAVKLTHSHPPTHSQIARFMWQPWDPPGSCHPRWTPCWPHELCYQGSLTPLNHSLISPHPFTHPTHPLTHLTSLAHLTSPLIAHSTHSLISSHSLSNHWLTSLTHSLTHSFIPTHQPAHSLTHLTSLARLFIHSSHLASLILPHSFNHTHSQTHPPTTGVYRLMVIPTWANH